MPGKGDWTDLDRAEPLRDTDTVRVYHGFRDFNLALRAISKGISGQEVVGRVYSYETNNNPKGLFVSTSIKVAGEFSSSYGVAVVIEFQCRAKDLEAAVWPSGNYTVQGQMSQYFNDPSERETQRLKDREDVKGMRHMPEPVKKSDRPELAQQLMASRELQALFMGHLDPNMIRAVWVREPVDGYQRVDKAFSRMTRQAFLSKYGKTKVEWGHEDSYEMRVFKPTEEWNTDKFIDTLATKFYGGKHRIDDPKQEIIDGAKYMGDHQILCYVWPKQYEGAVKWLHQIKGIKEATTYAWQRQGYEGVHAGVGYIDPKGEPHYHKSSHYDLARELGMKYGADLVLRGVRLTMRKNGSQESVSLEMMAKPKPMLHAMRYILDHEPDDVHVDIHHNDDLNHVERNDTFSGAYHAAAAWLRDKRAKLLRD